MLHGAYTAQECLKAGVLDVLEIQLRPVLLGQGRRWFDRLPAEHIELDLVRTLKAPGVLHLRYQVHHREVGRRSRLRPDGRPRMGRNSRSCPRSADVPGHAAGSRADVNRRRYPL